jgi:hypothetical protein
MILGFGGHLLPEAFIDGRLCMHSGFDERAALQAQVRRWRLGTASLGPATGLRAIVDVAALPLASILGFVPIGQLSVREESIAFLYRASNERVLLLTTAWGAQLSRFWREAVADGTRAGASWCLLFNGISVRLLCLTRSYSRRHVELDLDAVADEARSTAALQLLFTSHALGDESADSLRRLLSEADRHADGVRRSLRDGVLDASTAILSALVARERVRPVNDVFEQSLTIVYRLLFLLFAEARDLVPLWHPVYRESYSVEALRDAALDRSTVGLWDGLRAVTRLAHAGCRAGGLKVTAFNGRLFSPARTPLAERRGLDDEAARQAIVAVSTRPAADGEGRERIAYRDLGVEQLGAVYETLLDYAPAIERTAPGRALRVSLAPGSGVRKATGTFYTPQSLVDYLVRDVLTPLVSGASPEQILDLEVLDPSMGSGAFLVGACRFLADAYESALIDCGRCHASDIGLAERASIRRLIAERCLFGVDINPTAVQLARLSLWLTTLAADRPLTFLDHHLRVGDSLTGTWLSRLRARPARCRAARELPLFAESAPSKAICDALPIRFSLALEPNDTAAQVRAKERALQALSAAGSPLSRWMRVADAWCAAWLSSPPVPAEAFAALSDQVMTGRSALSEASTRALLARVDETRAARRLFHWELEFPEVFFDASGARRPDGGFDAVLGNPPWDMIRADGLGDRGAARAEASAYVRFVRESGVYRTRADGHVNRYQLFVERAVSLAKPGGRLGLVLPSGIVADANSAALRRYLFSHCALERLVGFDNRTGTFPIHRSVKFVLLTASAGAQTGDIACRFGETDPSALERSTEDEGRPPAGWFTTRVTPSLLRQISGDDLSIPDIRSPIDLAVLERAVQLFRPVGSAGGWKAHFGRELNATEDRDRMRQDGKGLPVLEGKHIEPFRVSQERARWHIDADSADRLLGTRWHRSRLAYRDVASATNRVTLIAAILPPRSVSTHTLFCLKTPMSMSDQHLLCALFNSLVVNFLVRMRVTTHVTTAIVERLPLPRPDQLAAYGDELAAAADRLSRGHDQESFALLNARVAAIYELREAELAHVLETFPLIDRPDRAMVLEHFRRL